MRLFIYLLFSPLILYPVSRFYIGPEIFYRDYHEVIPGYAKSDEYGFMYGLQTGYEYCQPPYYFHIFGDLSYGRTTYDGTIIYIEEQIFEPCLSFTDNRIYDIEADFGYWIYTHLKNRINITPLFGMGYHNWFREGEVEDDYDEEYSWAYFLLGLKCEKFSCNKKIGFLVKGQYTNSASVEVTRLFTHSINLDLENRFQYFTEIYVQYFLDKLDLKFNLFYKTENIGGSSKKIIEEYIISIPSSKTYQLGIQLQLGIRF